MGKGHILSSAGLVDVSFYFLDKVGFVLRCEIQQRQDGVSIEISGKTSKGCLQERGCVASDSVKIHMEASAVTERFLKAWAE